MPWTKDWYAHQPWENAEGSNFYSSVQDRRYGGDLKGIIDKLGYIDSLGINAIYLNPVLYAPSLHKYDQTSYVHIDPYFGPNPAGDIALIATETMDSSTWHWTSADTMFLGLVRDAHKLGIKVIMDGVFNHCGIYFPPFLDVQSKGQSSAFKDWFVITSYSPFQYEGWDGVQQMPVFATTPDGTNMAAGPKNHIFQITRRWMNPDGNVADGIDGWRLDTVPDVPIDFWTDWNTFVRSINPDAYTSSEVWTDASATVAQGRFSGTMNYYFSAMPIVDYLVTGSETATSFAADVTTAVSHYGTASALANQDLIDSHDTERMITMVSNAGITTSYNTPNYAGSSNSFDIDKPSAHDREVQNLMVLAQFTIPGAPMVYAGDEMGMWGAGDPDCRMPLSWPDINMAPQATDPRGLARTPDDVNFDSAVYNVYHSMIAMHKAYTSLQIGSFQSLYSNDGAKTLAFTRSYGSEILLVLLNRNEAQQSITLKTSGLVTSTQGVFLVNTTQSDPSTVSYTRNDTSLTFTLPAVAGAVYRFAVTNTASVPLENGWNLVSVPRDSGNTGWNSLFPTASATPYMYTGSGYAAVGTLQPGVGYWVKVPALDTASISGTEMTTRTIALNAGWNIIGSISSPVSVNSITSESPGLIISQFFGYTRGYTQADSLSPGYGYWVRASVAGSVTLNAGSVAASRTRVKIVPTADQPPAPPVGAALTNNLPKEFALSQNYPNPFNPTTLIEYALPKQSYVTLTLYNVLGQQVAKLVDGEQQPGYKSVTFNGSNLSSGLYFYRLNAGSFTSVKKMMIVK
jgi:glycosidase